MLFLAFLWLNLTLWTENDFIEIYEDACKSVEFILFSLLFLAFCIRIEINIWLYSSLETFSFVMTSPMQSKHIPIYQTTTKKHVDFFSFVRLLLLWVKFYACFVVKIRFCIHREIKTNVLCVWMNVFSRAKTKITPNTNKLSENVSFYMSLNVYAPEKRLKSILFIYSFNIHFSWPVFFSFSIHFLSSFCCWY